MRPWGRMQRRVRRLVPAPVRRADLAVFRRLSRTKIPVVGPMLPRLSTAANHSRLWLAIGLVLGTVGGRFGRRAAVRGMVAIAVTSAVTNLPAKLLTGRQRPDLELVPQARRLARLPTSTSFPSGHSASAFAFATAVGLELPSLRSALLPLAAAVATSRVYTGVHYPGDALVGSAIGAAVAHATTRSWPLVDPSPAAAPTVEAVDVGADGEGLVVVVNHGAGVGPRDGPVDLLRRELPAARIVEADRGEELAAALRRVCPDATVLGVAGGDGSAAAGAAVAHEAGMPLAVIPSGTLNFLAKALGLEDVRGTVEAVRSGHAVAMDVAEVDGQLFVNAVRLGGLAEVVRERERWEGWVGKWPAALWALIRVLATGEPLALEIDGRPRRVWVAFIGNCTFGPRGMTPTQRERLDDGVLDVRIVLADLPWARLRVLGSLLTGGLEGSPAIERWLTREVEFRSAAGPMAVVTDGEAREGAAAIVVRKRDRPLVVLRRPA